MCRELRSKESGRRTIRRLWWMVFETAREVRERVRIGFVKKTCSVLSEGPVERRQEVIFLVSLYDGSDICLKIIKFLEQCLDTQDS